MKLLRRTSEESDHRTRKPPSISRNLRNDEPRLPEDLFAAGLGGALSLALFVTVGFYRHIPRWESSLMSLDDAELK